mmetsp:Transcript_17518/g.33760  ORF Transcript_17518/g.33760 Transcript_17518/m.33760 type:complete len:81 (-) Transcript_17518:34-276(-)
MACAVGLVAVQTRCTTLHDYTWKGAGNWNSTTVCLGRWSCDHMRRDCQGAAVGAPAAAASQADSIDVPTKLGIVMTKSKP